MQLSQVFLGQVGSGPLTAPCDCTHICVLGGFWDITELERDTGFLLFKAEGNTPEWGTCFAAWRPLIGGREFFIPLLIGDICPLAASFRDATIPLVSRLLGVTFSHMFSHALLEDPLECFVRFCRHVVEYFVSGPGGLCSALCLKYDLWISPSA